MATKYLSSQYASLIGSKTQNFSTTINWTLKIESFNIHSLTGFKKKHHKSILMKKLLKVFTEYEKVVTYEKLLINYIFISSFPYQQLKPLVRGDQGDSSLSKKLEGRYIQEKTGNKNATSHIIQAISMTVQRGNATSIMGTLGPLRKLEDFFDVISPREEKP